MELKKIISILDYTSLKEKDNEKTVEGFCQKANTVLGPVAAICLYPKFIKYAKNLLQKSKIKIATVINFPHGNENLESIKKQIKKALKDGADEIDLVIPYQEYIQLGKSPQAILLVQEAKKICQQKCLKVILETGELKKKNLILAASKDAIFAGANFIKTSTGKTDIGATKEAVEIILQSIQTSKNKVGLKISGGIRNKFQVKEYLTLTEKICGEKFIHPSSFRIGASSLLDFLLSSSHNNQN